jgi:hypothetical protein
MSTITAIIIYKKLNDDLEKCLRTTGQVADDIVVLDPVQSEQVMMKCRDNHYKYLKVESEGIKKSLIQTIKGTKPDYILFLNSNEYLSGQLRDSLLSSRKKLNCDAYRLNVLKNYYGQWMKYSGLYPDFQIRLLKRKVEYHIDGEIEKIMVTGENNMIGSFTGDLFCVKYRNIWEHIQTVNDVTETNARKLFREGMRTNVIRIVLKPLGNFVTVFFVKLGFMDGFYGIINAVISGCSEFLKQVKLRELRKLSNKK